MPRIYARLNDKQYKKVKKRAKEKGFTKKSGEANISQYVRWLIDNDNSK